MLESNDRSYGTEILPQTPLPFDLNKMKPFELALEALGMFLVMMVSTYLAEPSMLKINHPFSSFLSTFMKMEISTLLSDLDKTWSRTKTPSSISYRLSTEAKKGTGVWRRLLCIFLTNVWLKRELC